MPYIKQLSRCAFCVKSKCGDFCAGMWSYVIGLSSFLCAGRKYGGTRIKICLEDGLLCRKSRQILSWCCVGIRQKIAAVLTKTLFSFKIET